MPNHFGPHRDAIPAPIGRPGRELVLRVEGDLVVATAAGLYQRIRAAARRREIRTVVLDFTGAARVDSAGVAVLSLGQRRLARAGKAVELRALGEQHKAALALVPRTAPSPESVHEAPGVLERVGDALLTLRDRFVLLVRLVAETFEQSVAVLMRRRRLPAGALAHQSVTMGVDALFIVGLLAFLMGMTMAFQGTVQLERFGAGVYVVDLVGLSTVREFAPLMTAIILSGRAGAAIAAELGTMRAGAEIDALEAMGVNPIRFLVVPRLGALSMMVPALTLLAMFFGIAGGMLVAALSLGMSPPAFIDRIAERVELLDFVHGLGKSLLFAWIITVTGAFFGLHTPGNARAVGAATTRTVVVCIFFILLTDAAFATVPALLGAKP
ncbi:MAG TPA: ABC transporter permease [Kofleriaceae bacterium]|nr:ABC transporter permease [Kofleriaceae bacterium]